jgi:Acetyltransferase (GNAT) domain
MLDGAQVRLAGLGAVFTQPAMRGRGAAAELIQRLCDRLASEGCDAALLFSEIGSEYYARLGFATLPLDDRSLRVIEDPRRGAPATMVRSGHDRDLDDIVAMDAARAAPYRFHLIRDRELTSFAITRKRLLAGLGPPGQRGLEFFIAEEGASAAAYVVIDTRSERWTIDSCGDRDPSGARIGAILQVLVAREPSQHRASITAWLPETLRPPQIEIVGASPSGDVMMWRGLSDRGRLAVALLAKDILYWRGDAF